MPIYPSYKRITILIRSVLNANNLLFSYLNETYVEFNNYIYYLNSRNCELILKSIDEPKNILYVTDKIKGIQLNDFEDSQEFYILFFHTLDKETNVLILIFPLQHYYIKYVLENQKLELNNIKNELKLIHEDDSYIFINHLTKDIFNLGLIGNTKLRENNKIYFYNFSNLDLGYDYHFIYDVEKKKWENIRMRIHAIRLTIVQNFSLIKILKSNHKSVLYKDLKNDMLKDNNITNLINIINCQDNENYNFDEDLKKYNDEQKLQTLNDKVEQNYTKFFE